VNDVSLGEAMRDMAKRFGATWSGFSPNIGKPTDSPLAVEIKKIITKMIRSQPSDRILINRVVKRLAGLKNGTLQQFHDGVDNSPNSTLKLARCRADYSAFGGPPATPAGGVAAA
jgi:hypothetical protein